MNHFEMDLHVIYAGSKLKEWKEFTANVEAVQSCTQYDYAEPIIKVWAVTENTALNPPLEIVQGGTTLQCSVRGATLVATKFSDFKKLYKFCLKNHAVMTYAVEAYKRGI